MKILLVDDDTSVIQSLLAILRSLPGHDVRVATTGEKAKENAATLGGVDLLITDVVMEPMDGFTLRDHLATLYTGMRTILITGYDLSEHGAQVGSNRVMAKPVGADDLREAVNQELAAMQQAAPAAARPVPVARAVATPGVQPRTTAQPYAAGAAPRQGTVQPRTTTGVRPVARAMQPASEVAEDPSATRYSANGSPAHALDPDLSPNPPAAAPPATENPAVEDAHATDHDAGTGLIGQMIGGYQIVSHLGEGRWGTVYAAVQTSINRPVGLKVLAPSRARDESQKNRFTADARAKAHVQHPSILAVYEAGESDGWIFYTHEYVDGQNLAEMAANGHTVDENTALKILKVAGEGMAYFARNNTPHTPLDHESLYLGVDGHARLSNLATHMLDQPVTPDVEMSALARSVVAILPSHGISTGLRALLGRMQQGGPAALAGWGALLHAVKALEPKVVPIEAAKISAQDRAAIAAVEAARKQQKRSFYLTIASMVSLVMLLGWVVWYVMFSSNERVLNAQVQIPAGAFLFGNAGQSATTEAFEIDKYEVSIGQYAKFVEWIQKNPGDEHAYDHPRQPRQFGHVPAGWDIYYKRAVRGLPVASVPTSLNSPMVEITWWDAYAYAKFRGRSLPTEQEWEKAARGMEGTAYPWGDQPDPKRANTGEDHKAHVPGEKGAVDGYNYYNDVDEMKGDKSPFDVVGMAGNVSEWTDSWTEDKRHPIVKGGNFTIPAMPSAERLTEQDPHKGVVHIGFRTVARKAAATP